MARAYTPTEEKKNVQVFSKIMVLKLHPGGICIMMSKAKRGWQAGAVGD